MIKSLYSMGLSSLLNTQYSIGVHGNNVTNAQVPGYRRRTVEMESRTPLDFGFGTVGTGATIAQIHRNLSRFIEEQYLQRQGEGSKWTALSEQVNQAEKLFKVGDEEGLATILSEFWTAWGTMASDQGSSGARSNLLGKAETLAQQLRHMRSSLDSQQHQIDEQLKQQVNEANTIISDLAGLNQAIAASPDNNDLLDKRDALLRSLTDKIGIRTSIHADGQVTVSTMGGRNLVDGSNHYSLSFDGPGREKALAPGSGYTDDIYYEGFSNSELTIDVLTDGPADGSAGAATYRVSLDGGTTWLTNEDGSEKVFTAGGPDEGTTIDGVKVWFGQEGDGTSPATTDLHKGDRFTIVPKSSVYWNRTTSNKECIAPHPPDMEGGSGRESGGSIVGLLAARDSCLGSYSRELDTMTESLIWEINRIHSQGANGQHHESLHGQDRVDNTGVPLVKAGLHYGARLEKGGLSFALFDKTTGQAMGKTSVDFSSINPPGIATFDPEQHSLEDVRDAINASMGGNITASIENNALVLASGNNTVFETSSDTSGLLAGLGINNFFDGHGGDDIEVSQSLASDPSAICVGHVNGAGEINPGDVDTAKALSKLGEKDVLFSGASGDRKTTFADFLGGLTGRVGADASGAKFSSQAQQALSQDLYARQEGIGGVNRDEELTTILELNKNYSAASRLIQTASEMFDVVLSLK